MIHDHRGAAGAGGFTLVEVIVALGLASLFSLIMMHGVGLAARGLDRLSRHAEQLDERRGLELQMRRALGSAVSIAVAGGEPGFIGRPTSLDFLSVVEDGGPGLYRVRLVFDAAGGANAVTLSRSLAMTTGRPPRDKSVLVHRARHLEISYFGAASPSEAPGWHREWTGIAYLPQLVRITLDSGDGRTRPPIILRLRNAG